MAKAKAKSKKRSATRGASSQKNSAFAVGDRVRVKSGDFGGSVGQVESVRGSKCALRIGREVHEFDSVNVERGGPRDRV